MSRYYALNPDGTLLRLTPYSHDGNVNRMTEQTYDRSLEGTARRRLEKQVADTVARIRATADEIERDARRNIASAADEKRGQEFLTYPRVAGQVAHSVQTLLFNLPLESMIDAATDAETGRMEKNR